MLAKYINKIYIKIVQNIIKFLIQSVSESSNYIFISQLPRPVRPVYRTPEDGACMSLIILSDHIMRLGD